MDRAVSIFKSVTSVKSFKKVGFDAIIREVRNSTYQGLPKEQRPLFTPHCTIADRRTTDYTLNGIVHLDIDHLDNEEMTQKLRSDLSNDPIVYAVFISPSRRGIKVFARYRDIPFSLAFQIFADYISNKYQVPIDRAVKDIKRLCFIGDDAGAGFRQNSVLLDELDFQIPIDEVPIDEGITDGDTGDILRQAELFAERKTGRRYETGNRNNYLFFLCLFLFNVGYPKIDAVLEKYDLPNAEKEKIKKSASRYKIKLKRPPETPQKSDKKMGLIVENYAKNNGFASLWMQTEKEGDVIIGLVKRVCKNVYRYTSSDVLASELAKIYPGKFDRITALCSPKKVGTALDRVGLYDLHRNTPARVILPIRSDLFLSVTQNGANFVQTLDNLDKPFVLTTEFKSPIYTEVTKNWNYHIANNITLQFMLRAVFGKKEKYTEVELFGLLSIVGYLVSGIYDVVNTVAIFFTDRKSVDADVGGSGKSLFARLLSKAVNTAYIDGKAFSRDNRFKFAGINGFEKLIIIEDAKERFDFQALYVGITDFLEVEHKFADPIKIPPEMGYKFLITANRLRLSNDVSATRRRLIVEFSDYYNEKYTPYDDFGKQLIEEYTPGDWGDFWALIGNAVQMYLIYGLDYAKMLFSNKLSEEKQLIYYQEYDRIFNEMYDDGTTEIVISQCYDVFKRECRNVGLNKFSKDLYDYLQLKGYRVTRGRKDLDGKKQTVFEIRRDNTAENL